MNENAIAINAQKIATVNGKPPEWAMLIPKGTVSGRDGRAWNNSNPDGIVASFVGSMMDAPVDIEHSTEKKAPKGEPAPAVGWVKELQSRNGEIWGRFEWNTEGETLVGERAYRYLSPVILYDPKSGEIGGLTSVALTNQPNLKLPALNSQQGGDAPPNTEVTMDLKELLAALSLPETATMADIMAKIKELQGNVATATNRAENPPLTKFVPRADFDAVLAKATNAEQSLASIKQERLETAINAAIDTALKDGKITPATADYHRAQCRQEGGLDRFAEFVKSSPVIGAASGLDGKKPEGETKALNAQEKAVCLALGISEEAYLKTAA